MERINIDDEQPSRIRRLHPTLKRCACGMTGSKHEFYKHMDVELEQSRRVGMTVNEFWTLHGEVPYNIEEDEMVEVDWTK